MCFTSICNSCQYFADFAAGNQMNQLADARQFIVVYPQQTTLNNPTACWNWFVPADQSRGSGEPAILAGIVQTVEQNTSRWSIDTNRVYVAGAVMSIILGVTYSDLFAAIGVAAGGEYPAATNPMSAGIGEVFGGPDPTRQGQGAL